MGMGMGVRGGRGGMRSCRRQVRYIGVGVVSRYLQKLEFLAYLLAQQTGRSSNFP